MIAVDTSAVVAIVADESDARILSEALAAADERVISAGSVLELTMIGARIAADAIALVEDALTQLRIVVEPFDGEQLRIAQRAFVTYGKGRHPAALNFGDCFAYALAKSRRIPLLYKGDDFARTDVRRAPQSR